MQCREILCMLIVVVCSLTSEICFVNDLIVKKHESVDTVKNCYQELPPFEIQKEMSTIGFCLRRSYYFVKFIN